MLRLLETLEPKPCQVEARNELIPLNLTWPFEPGQPSLWLRFGDGSRNLVELSFTLDGRVKSVTLVTHRGSEIAERQPVLASLPESQGLPRFSVEQFWAQVPEGAYPAINLFDAPALLFVQPRTAELVLRRGRLVRYLASSRVGFGLSAEDELLSVRVDLEPLEAEALLGCSTRW